MTDLNQSPPPKIEAIKRFKDMEIFKELDIPPTWTRLVQKTSFGSATTYTEFKADSPQIVVFPHSRPISKNAITAFSKLLEEKLDPDSPKLLFADAPTTRSTPAATAELFKSIAPVLGTALIGDNQIVNRALDKDARKPAFHLDIARLRNLSDRNVLEVIGWFIQHDDRGMPRQDENGGPLKRYYDGIFALDDIRSGNITELYLIATSEDSYKKGQEVFAKTLSTLRWKSSLPLGY